MKFPVYPFGGKESLAKNNAIVGFTHVFFTSANDNLKYDNTIMSFCSRGIIAVIVIPIVSKIGFFFNVFVCTANSISFILYKILKVDWIVNKDICLQTIKQSIFNIFVCYLFFFWLNYLIISSIFIFYPKCFLRLSDFIEGISLDMACNFEQKITKEEEGRTIYKDGFNLNLNVTFKGLSEVLDSLTELMELMILNNVQQKHAQRQGKVVKPDSDEKESHCLLRD